MLQNKYLVAQKSCYVVYQVSFQYANVKKSLRKWSLWKKKKMRKCNALVVSNQYSFYLGLSSFIQYSSFDDNSILNFIFCRFKKQIMSIRTQTRIYRAHSPIYCRHSFLWHPNLYLLCRTFIMMILSIILSLLSPVFLVVEIIASLL